MKPKIRNYINEAEKDLREGTVKHGIVMSTESLYSRLDLFIIPCVSMTKDDSEELKKGLSEMVKKYTQQTSFDFKSPVGNLLPILK